uniref:Uncharacterized protein n=1 Tax=Romanomermis culicivorax TaxID=13658 RepID=A0A915JD28_ROMCU
MSTEHVILSQNKATSAKINEGVGDDEDFGIEFGDIGQMAPADEEETMENEISDSDSESNDDDEDDDDVEISAPTPPVSKNFAAKNTTKKNALDIDDI